MTKVCKVVALGAAVVGVALCPSAFAQDDLDDLLKELDAETSETAKPAVAETPADAETPVVEEPAAEEPTATETPVVEEPTAEEPAVEETPVVEEPTAAEEPAVEETPAVEEPAVEETTVADLTPEEPAAVEPTPAPAPAVATTPTLDDNAELKANLVATERIRRQALDAQAKREINEARACLKANEHMEAVRHYGLAEKFLNDRASVKNLRKECNDGMAVGLFREAQRLWKLNHRAEALARMEEARDRQHPKAQSCLEKWRDEGISEEPKTDDENVHVKHNEDYKAMRAEIRTHLRRSKQFLGLRQMDKALEECEIVLRIDSYNEEAIRIRKAIEKKRQFVLEKERDATHEGMIADVDQAWRPVYAINAAKLSQKSSETVKAQTGDDPERTQEQDIERRMKEMRLPNISFKPPATIIEAVDFFRQASKDYDRPDIPSEKRGFNFVLRTPPGAIKTAVVEEEGSDDFSASNSDEPAGPTNGLEPIQTITASDITFYEALKLVCDSVNYKFIVSGQVVMVMPADMSTAELIARKYNVPEAFVERVTSAADEMKTMGGFGSNSRKKAAETEEEGEGQDWKGFFEEMGVKWPEGSSIKHIKALGKLYVRNTRENLAEFEKVLDELGGQPQLIEIETRFVEVSQEDLNSLGFEWILNSDYSLNIGDKLGKALGVGTATWGTVSGNQKWGNTTAESVTDGYTIGSNGSKLNTSSTTYSNTSTYDNTYTKTLTPYSQGGTLINDGNQRMIGINAFGGTADYGNTSRYLSTVGNHISGQAKSTNDQFMRVNAFLGNADLSMILHMLAQRSDTDLLSAPKIVTKSGENAVIKVVTEFIYPQDYNVQLQSSSSSGSSYGGSQSAVLAIVEPQNFTMREVGVILDVTPTYSEANGGTIDLELKPQVVDEPTWKNYGMSIPFTGNSSLQNFEGIGGIFEGLAQSIEAIGGGITDEMKSWIISTETQAAQDALSNLTRSSSDNMTYYEAPMEQPFFHVRSIDSKVSITPGATVVMGGLITEQRKAMDDKIPFLGDLPFIGRLFRSHAEQTKKRNLLIFVTGRLITPAGREIRMNEEREGDKGDIKAAPSAN